LKGAEDKKLSEYAKNNNLLLITQDQKLAKIAARIGAKCVLVSEEKIARAVYAEIREKYPSR